MALLITDGKQTPVVRRGEPHAEDVAKAMKSRGIQIQVMAIAQADPVELSKYASSTKYLSYVPDFSKLNSQVERQVRALCPGKLRQHCITTVPL